MRFNLFRKIFFSLAIMLSLTGSSIGQYKQDVANYILTYRDIAVKEMERTGIPASIKLAQGILESGAGKSELSVNANNHFGIKCGKDWNGQGYSLEDDDFDTLGVLTKSCFRVYNDATESYIAHSEFLRNPAKNSRYGFLFALDPRDYKEWAYGLKKAGYATNPKYAHMLIKSIEENKLYEYDVLTSFDVAANVNPANPEPPIYNKNDQKKQRNINKLSSINDVKVLMVNDGSSLSEIAEQYDVSIKSLMAYNSDIKSKTIELDKQTMIFLSPRRGSYRGKNKWHYVKKGEDIASIAKEYAIKESYLLRKNNLKKKEEPAIGSRLALRGWAIFHKKPVLSKEKKTILPKQPSKPIKQDEDHNSAGKAQPSVTHTPNREVTVTIADGNPTSKNSNAFQYHQIEKGDTLYNLSKKYNTSVDSIKTINNLGDEGIKIGQTIRIQ